jgi:hypothetical protein
MSGTQIASPRSEAPPIPAAKQRISATARAAFARLWPYSLLGVQNLLVFWGHYFKDFGFPWDFPMAYYGYVVYWTTAVSKGIFPTWVPFQMMGYPMALNLQSGIYYPPLWIFSLLNIPYKLHAAVVLQCLHVFFGGIGMFLFLKLIIKSPSYAILGAVIFQFFGGFYSNSQHVDIIRAYAFIPWMLYLFTVRGEKVGQIPKRFLLIPLFIYLFSTGGYPGNLTATLLVLALYLSLQMIDLFIKEGDIRPVFSVAWWAGLLTLTALMLSAVQLAPAWIGKEYLTRFSELGSIGRALLGFEHYPALFLSNEVVPGEPSMTSSYMTLPALMLACFITFKRAKETWTIGLSGLFALLMLPGPGSFVWSFLAAFIEPVKFSRFPASDYRLFVIITLIVLALLGLKSLLSQEVSFPSLVVRTGFISLWFGQAVFMSYPDLISRIVLKVLIGAALSYLLILVLYTRGLRRGSSSRLTPALLLAVLTVISLDAARVIPHISSWRVHEYSNYYALHGWQLEDNGRLLTYQAFDNLPARRPARIEKIGFEYTWQGYLTGSYVMGDKTPCLLLACQAVENNPLYKEYMFMEWTPLVIELPDKSGSAEAFISDQELAALLQEAENERTIQQVSYGINEVSYRMELERPVLVVENEIFYPGWRAILTAGDGSQQVVEAVATNDTFRSWPLPAGSYQMTSTYQFPRMPVYLGVSLAAAAGWLLTAVIFLRRYSGRSQRKFELGE